MASAPARLMIAARRHLTDVARGEAPADLYLRGGTRLQGIAVMLRESSLRRDLHGLLDALKEAPALTATRSRTSWRCRWAGS